MRSVTFHYLTFQSGKSNKFYCLVQASASRWVRGNGARGTKGVWNVVSDSKAKDLLQEKKGEGYTSASITDLSQKAFDAIKELFKQETKETLQRQNDRLFADLTSGGNTANAGPAGQRTAEPSPFSSPNRRSEKKSFLKGWL